MYWSPPLPLNVNSSPAPPLSRSVEKLVLTKPVGVLAADRIGVDVEPRRAAGLAAGVDLDAVELKAAGAGAERLRERRAGVDLLVDGGVGLGVLVVGLTMAKPGVKPGASADVGAGVRMPAKLRGAQNVAMPQASAAADTNLRNVMDPSARDRLIPAAGSPKSA